MSRAFDQWRLVDRDQRAFRRFGLRIARETYERLWEETGQEPGDPDGPDLVESFDAKIDGLWPSDYEWMFLAAVVRDAVTNFEVYLESAAAEVLAAHGVEFVGEMRWRDLREFFDRMGVPIASERVRRIRDLRHFLTHQRGELRTEKQRERFASESGDSLPPIVVRLDEQSVVAMMDDLATAVRSVDAAVWEHSWGPTRLAGLVAGSAPADA